MARRDILCGRHEVDEEGKEDNGNLPQVQVAVGATQDRCYGERGAPTAQFDITTYISHFGIWSF